MNKKLVLKLVANFLVLSLLLTPAFAVKLNLIDNVTKLQETALSLESLESYDGEYTKNRGIIFTVDQNGNPKISECFGYKLKEGHKYLIAFPLIHEYNELSIYIKTIYIEEVESITKFKEVYLLDMANESKQYGRSMIKGMPDIHFSVIPDEKCFLNQNTLSTPNTCVIASMVMASNMQGVKCDPEKFIRTMKEKESIPFNKEGMLISTGIQYLKDIGILESKTFLGSYNKEKISYSLLVNKRPVLISEKNNVFANAENREIEVTNFRDGYHVVVISGFYIKGNEFGWEVFDPNGNDGAGCFIKESTQAKLCDYDNSGTYDIEVKEPEIGTLPTYINNSLK